MERLVLGKVLHAAKISDVLENAGVGEVRWKSWNYTASNSYGTVTDGTDPSSEFLLLAAGVWVIEIRLWTCVWPGRFGVFIHNSNGQSIGNTHYLSKSVGVGAWESVCNSDHLILSQDTYVRLYIEHMPEFSDGVNFFGDLSMR